MEIKETTTIDLQVGVENYKTLLKIANGVRELYELTRTPSDGKIPKTIPIEKIEEAFKEDLEEASIFATSFLYNHRTFFDDEIW